jgi:hypothetical protein
MFLLSLCLFAWTLAVLLAATLSWLLSPFLCYHFRLCRAEILVVAACRDAFDVKSSDVTQPLLALGLRRTRRVALLPMLMGAASRDDDTTAILTKCRDMETVVADRRGCATPVCFVDVRYTARPCFLLGLLGRPCRGLYRCLYPIYSFSDKITFPPLCGSVWNRTSGKESSVSNAVLTMRVRGKPTSRQLFCNVTNQLRLLEGPLKDFHRETYPGYQLRRHILRAVLISDIQALQDSALEARRGSLSSAAAAAAPAGSVGSAGSAGDPTQPAARVAAPPPNKASSAVKESDMSISLRFQFRSHHHHRIDVMTLRAY